MTMVVLDSSDKEAVLADALVEAHEPEKKDAEDKGETAAGGDGTVSRETKQADKTVEVDPHPDDVEGEDGLTANQKKELSAKMLKAIGKKHREMKEAEEFAAAQYNERKLAEERANRLQAALDAAKGAQPAKAEEAPAKPDRQNFATETEYIDAMIKFGVAEGLREQAAKQAKEAQDRAFAEMEAAAKQRISDAIKIVPDFVDVTGAADVEVPPAVAGYMQESPMFAELGYYLAKNPDVVVSLSKLKPALQLVQIGKIESTLQPFSKEKSNGGAKPQAVTEAVKASETTGITPSKARDKAPVIQPLNTTGTAFEKDEADMGIREVISDWTKKNGTNLAMRKRH